MDREIKVEVEHSPQRCPYCHDEVDSRDDGWLACAGCLARHHEDCWQELGRCSSCADDRSLALGGHASAGSVTTIRPTRHRNRFTQATRQNVYNVLWWVTTVGAFVGVSYFWDRLGCFSLMAIGMAHTWLQSTLKGLLGLNRKKSKKKKKKKKRTEVEVELT
jgi:hypothetical protein